MTKVGSTASAQVMATTATPSLSLLNDAGWASAVSWDITQPPHDGAAVCSPDLGPLVSALFAVYPYVVD